MIAPFTRKTTSSMSGTRPLPREFHESRQFGDQLRGDVAHTAVDVEGVVHGYPARLRRRQDIARAGRFEEFRPAFANQIRLSDIDGPAGLPRPNWDAAATHAGQEDLAAFHLRLADRPVARHDVGTSHRGLDGIAGSHDFAGARDDDTFERFERGLLTSELVSDDIAGFFGTSFPRRFNFGGRMADQRHDGRDLL